MTTLHPALGIRDILVASSLVELTGWTVQLGRLQDVDKSIAIYDTGGQDPEPALSIDYPTIMIMVLGTANTGYTEAYTMCANIKAALLGIPALPTEYPELNMCNMVGDINQIGYNDNNRPRFTMNFQLITSPEPVGYRESA